MRDEHNKYVIQAKLRGRATLRATGGAGENVAVYELCLTCKISLSGSVPLARGTGDI